MTEILLPTESDPPLLGNMVLDSLRFVQVRAFEFSTLHERRQFAVHEAGKMSLAQIQIEEWDMGVDALMSSSPHLDREDWIVAEQNVDVFAWVKNVVYVSGVSAPREGLALLLGGVRTGISEQQLADEKRQQPTRLMLQSGAVYASVLSINSWQPATPTS